MATRNLTMVIPYERYKKGYCNPDNYEDYSCVNMYLHHDGYPSWQGVQLANWVKANNFGDPTRSAAKLVRDMYYNSCYLYNNHNEIDHQYTYMLFVGQVDTRIACYDSYTHDVIFDMQPDEIIKKYAEDMEYTDFANGQTRFMQGEGEDIKYHSNKLIKILKKF